jgi:hypothetical protein
MMQRHLLCLVLMVDGVLVNDAFKRRFPSLHIFGRLHAHAAPVVHRRVNVSKFHTVSQVLQGMATNLLKSRFLLKYWHNTIRPSL